MPTVTPGTLERARRGDEQAFAAIVEAYGGLVLNLAWRMTRDRQEAEDFSQEIFLRLWKVLDRFDTSRPFAPWLRRVARNLLLNLTAGKARRIRRQTASLDTVGGEKRKPLPDPRTAAAEVTAGTREEASELRGAISRLRERDRLILALRYFEGRSYLELAAELDLPIGTVKNRLYRAREALAREIGEIE